VYPLITWVPIVVLGHHQSFGAAWFLLAYVVGQTTTMAGLRYSVPVFVAAEATLVVEALTSPSPDRVQYWTGWFLGIAAAFIGGWIWRKQHALVAELSAAHQGLAERATLAERQRIAREVHDVVAHSLTVTLLHITGARMALRSDPEEAVEALAEAERVGRQSLDDVRRTVGLLAPAGGDGTAPPLPGLDDLPQLVAGYADAGVAVRLDVEGDPDVVSAATGLCLYRIAQESLANASRHAPGNPVDIRLCISAERAVLRVRNAGGGSSDGASFAGPGGRGIPGMRERTAALGGRLSAGEKGGGWLVEAAVPLMSPARGRWPPCH
jgi:signal transduction histidine kinase